MIKNGWAVIVNPAAGAHTAQMKWETIRNILIKEEFTFDPFITENSNHAVFIVKSCILDGYRKFIVVGGDGTVNEVINGIMFQDIVPSSEIVFGMIPVGSGNDWIRTWKIPRDIHQAILLIKNGTYFFHDAGKVSYFENNEEKTRWFLNAAGTGLDALVVKAANGKDKHGSRAISYFICLLQQLFRYHPVDTEVVVDDGEIITGKMLDLAIGICRYIGGGMFFFPDGNPSDGLFNITFIRKMKMLHIFLAVPKLFNGKLKKLSAVQTFTGKKVTINAKEPLLLETDGEVLGTTPFSFEITPQAVRIIAEKFSSVPE